MKSRLYSFISAISGNFVPSVTNLPTQKTPILLNLCRSCLETASSSFASIACSSETLNETSVSSSLSKASIDLEETLGKHLSPEGVFRSWGCSESDISKLLDHSPTLRNCHPQDLQMKLNSLSSLGVTASDILRTKGNIPPRFLRDRFSKGFQERIEYLLGIFKSKEVLRKAIIRNSSLLTYSLEEKVKPIIKMYEEIGITGDDLVIVLTSRPTLISRTSFNDEKWDYIRKTGVSMESKMYKYIVSTVAISRVETIREKLANIEKFGLSNEEVFGLIGRSPLLLTISAEKVQRNMTFICGTMKLSPRVILKRPPLLQLNLDLVMRPRFYLAKKIEYMGFVQQIEEAKLLTAMRMKEKRFVETFIDCYPQDIAEELRVFYADMKCIKRLAGSSKHNIRRSFPV